MTSMRIALWAATLWLPSLAHSQPLPVADGYRGCWYMNQPSKDEYKYKYSGGMATYPQQHVPIAVHSSQAQKTFFVFGGLVGNSRSLHHLIGYFDHVAGKVCRPRILLDKRTQDAHDNPTLQLDDAGHLWIFSASHGTARPSYIHRSTAPFSIDEFERVLTTNFSYPQPWHVANEGFLFLHTRYRPAEGVLPGGRWLYWMTASDGRSWAKPKPLAFIGMGDYQVSWRVGAKIGTAFDFHPKPLGLNGRTNIYYLETQDMGRTWKTADGRATPTPITLAGNQALVHDFQAEKKLVYLKDIAFDEAGRPVIAFLTADSFRSGPAGGERLWRTAQWTGKSWLIQPLATSDHNYDHGSLWIEPGGQWRLLAPTDPGPQPFGTGGDLVLWTSDNRGKSWSRARTVTGRGAFNHTYARKPVNAHPDFAALWADGNPFAPSESSLYFSDHDGRHVRRLPRRMLADFETPEALPVDP